MGFWVYVLQSEATGKLYTGQTSDPERRLQEHNHATLGHDRYTRKQKGPWRLIYSEPADSRAAAMKRERFFKSGQGREWIKMNILGQKLSCQSPPEAD